MTARLLIALLVISSPAFAQFAPLDASSVGGTVTIDRDRISLEEALHEVVRQANLNIVFSADLIGRIPDRPVHLRSVTVAEAFLHLLADTGLEALITDKGSIVIRPKEQRMVPQGQTVRGVILDRATRAPLTGANVVVVGSDPLIGTTADRDGAFVLEHVPLGRQDFRASYIGYRSIVLPQVLVTSGKEVVLEILLEEEVLSGAEILVTADLRKDQPLNEMSVVSARSFSVEETRRYAGGLDDPARMASSFAGVAAGAGIQENGIIVRGNAPKGVLWRLEGVEIPNPNHFAGLVVMGAGGVTLFSSQLLDNSDFLTGAFSPEYGNALAGVFDMNFRSGNPSAREHTVQAGLIGIDLASEGPFSRGNRSTYLVNYRYSTIGLLLPLLPTEDVASFQDLSFKLTFPTRKAGRFDVWGIGGVDAQSMKASEDSTEWEYEIWDRIHSDLDLAVGAAGVSHRLVFGERSLLHTTAAATVNRTLVDQKRIDDSLALRDNLSIDNTTGRVIVGTSLSHKFSPRHLHRAGVTLQQIFYDFDLHAAPFDRPPLVSIAAGSGSSSLLQGYASSRLEVTPRVSLQAGLHVEYFALTEALALEPRIGARYTIGAGAVSAGYGLHSQIEDLRIYFAGEENRDLGFARAHHWVMGYDRMLGEAVRVKVEGYYQRLFDVPVIADSSYSLINLEQDWELRDPLLNEGAGTNYGVEVTMERFLRGGFYYLASGSVFESEYRGGDGVWRPTRWDRSFTVNALAGKEFTIGQNLLGVNARVSAMGGMRRSPVDGPASIERQDVVFDEYRAFSERERGLFLVDVTLTYRRNHRRVSEVWALQVKNALVAKEEALDYNFRTRRVHEVREGFPLPMLSYKVEF